jgi:hypothetical protein
MHTDSKVLELSQIAIEEGRIEDARTLLRPLMERNVVESYFYASRVAYTQEQALEFLRYALLLEPENEAVKKQLTELEQVYEGNRPLAIVPSPEAEPVPSDNRIKKTVSLFKKHGWTLISREAKLAHLMRRRSTSAMSCFVMGLALNIVGLVLLVYILLSGEKIHVFVEVDEDDILLTSSKGEQFISHPQQAIIMIEKYGGVRFWQGMLFGFIGFAISSIVLAFLIWQMGQNLNMLNAMMNEVQATLTAQAPRF